MGAHFVRWQDGFVTAAGSVYRNLDSSLGRIGRHIKRLIFPVLERQFPARREFFPVLLLREFSENRCGAAVFCSWIGIFGSGLANFSVKFPVGRESISETGSNPTTAPASQPASQCKDGKQLPLYNAVVRIWCARRSFQFSKDFSRSAQTSRYPRARHVSMRSCKKLVRAEAKVCAGV